MFDLGWQEFMLIALIALIVVGPKDLPRVIRAVSQGIRRVRGFAREFHSSLEEVAREAELDDIRKQARDLANEGLDESLRKDLDPMSEIEQSIRDAQCQFNNANGDIRAAERELKSDIAKAQESAADGVGEPAAPEQFAPEQSASEQTASEPAQQPAQEPAQKPFKDPAADVGVAAAPKAAS